MNSIKEDCMKLMRQYPTIWDHISKYTHTIIKYGCLKPDQDEPMYIIHIDDPQILELLWAPATEYGKIIIVVIGAKYFKISNKLGLIIIDEINH